MTTRQHTASGVEAAILTRIIHPERDDLSQEAAKALLNVGIEREDLDRLHILVAKNQEGALGSAEQDELESYLRLSSIFDLMHVRASRSLKKHS